MYSCTVPLQLERLKTGTLYCIMINPMDGARRTARPRATPQRARHAGRARSRRSYRRSGTRSRCAGRLRRCVPSLPLWTLSHPPAFAVCHSLCQCLRISVRPQRASVQEGRRAGGHSARERRTPRKRKRTILRRARSPSTPVGCRRRHRSTMAKRCGSGRSSWCRLSGS